MKYLPILIFVFFICLPATAFADLPPMPRECDSTCFEQCFDCESGEISSDDSCSYCRLCRKLELQSQCPSTPTSPITEPTPTPTRPINLTPEDNNDDSSSCTGAPYASSHAPLAMLLLSLLMLGLAIPARKQ